MRMFLVIQEAGMRISELCLLPYDCLSQDAAGDWWLTYRQYKSRKDHTVTISRELVGVIQTQQQYIRTHLPPSYPSLFCANGGLCEPYYHHQALQEQAWTVKCLIDREFAPVLRTPRSPLLAYALNQLAERHQICTLAGELWCFQAHQFRHSLGTAMVNRGVPIHIISRFLGHETLGMTQVYAHIHDATLKKEMALFHDRVVDITGQIIPVSATSVVDTTDHQWFKRNVLAQALPNGSCALPAVQKACPHANACLTCTHFRTTAEFLDQHKAQLNQTETLIEKAEANGWQRQVEMNRRIAQNLKQMIDTLETSGESA
jgi:integrase/recombinase XerD